MVTDLNSKIILCKNVHVDRDLKNVVDYSTATMLEMLNDSSHLVASRNKYSFIRTTGNISTDFLYEDVLKANYIAFQNYDYSNKWFFAFIDDVIYKGEKNTEIVYTIDAYTTFHEDITYSNCFVVREHVNDDTIGKNIVPENLDVGELVNEDSNPYAINELFIERQVSGLTIQPVYVVETEYVPNPRIY